VAALLDQADAALADGAVDRAQEFLDRIAHDERTPLDDARFRVVDGRVAMLAGRTRQAVDLLGRGATAADCVGGPDAVLVARTAREELITAALRQGRPDRAATIAAEFVLPEGPRQRLLAAAIGVGNGQVVDLVGIDADADALVAEDGVRAAAFVADTIGLALVWAERYDPADRLLDRLIRSARRDETLGPLPNLLAVAALADLRTNRYRAAAGHADEAVRLADRTARPGLTLLPLAVLAVAEAVRADTAGCRAAVDRLREAAARSGLGGDGAAAEVPARAALGLLHLGVDQPDRTVAELEPLVGHRAAPWLIMWQVDLVEALLRVGRHADAARVLQDFEAGLAPGDEGRAAAAAARARAQMHPDHADESERLLTWSEERLRALGSPFGLARTLLVRAHLRRGWGREAAAAADADHAASLFRRMGAEGWAARAATFSPAAGTGIASLSMPTPLTPQELQVAGLVVTGRSNQEVADTLFVSVRTVESHLGRIYRKLGVRSRGQLTARADDWGLRDQRPW
jgi:DNA-binding CsgD family transcriptional regulator